MSVKITVLYDNRSDNPALQEGWGFSALVEFQGSKILFDTGGDPDAFFANASRLQLSFSEVTHLLFSHRHWDHVAGIKELAAQLKTNTPLYVPKTFPWILLRKAHKLSRAKIVRSHEEIAPNIYALVLRGGFWLYELALVIKTPNGLGVVTGCGHPGIVQILEKAQGLFGEKVDFVLGGFHLLFTPAARCAEIVKQLQNMNVHQVAPCHCSGDHVIRQFQAAYGAHFFKVGTGSVLVF